MKKETGFSLIELLIVVAIIGIIAAIAIPNLLQARKTANEASAIGALRTIASAEVTYQGNNQHYGEIPQLNSAKLIDDTILNAYGSSGPTSTTPKSGYVFYEPLLALATSFDINADPKSPGSSGDRYFGINHTGVIRFKTTAPIVVTSTTTGDMDGTPLGTASAS